MIYWVLGIAAGIWGISRFLSSRGAQASVPSDPPAAPLATPPSASPAAPGSSSPFGTEPLPAFLGDPLPLVQGQRYRMRYDSQLLDPTTLMSSVTTYGLASLPSDWPLVTRDVSDSATMFASGTWTGASGSVPRPSGLWQVWATSSRA